MREMKDSGIAWIGAMPRAWKMNTIAQIFLQVKCKNTGLQEKNLLSLSYGKVKRKSIDTVEGLLPESFDGYNIIEKDDIVLRLTDLQNDHTSLRVGLAEERGIITSAYLTIRNRSNFCPKYLYYYLHSFDIAKGFYGMGAGVRQGLNWDGVKWLKILAPSVPEQERIAAFLDAECAEIDTVLEKTRASIEEYKKLKQAVITQAVTKGVRGDRTMKDSGIEWIGDIPAEWKVASIGRFCFVTKLAGFEFTNDMMSSIQDSGDIPIVRAQNIKMGKFINNISEFIPYRISQKLERCALNRKCLIITFIGAGIGEVAIFNEPKRYHLAPNVAKIVINVGMEHFVTEEYLLYFLMSFAGQEEINKIKKATAQPSLSMGTIRSIKIVLPDSIEEQSEIVNYLDMRCDSIDALIAKKQQYLTEIENYKKSLIYEYVTGKKEVV